MLNKPKKKEAAQKIMKKAGTSPKRIEKAMKEVAKKKVPFL